MKPSELQPKTSKAVGIAINKDRTARCLTCGVIWTPRTRKDGQLCAAWYLCPEGCNRGRLLPDPDRIFSRTKAGTGHSKQRAARPRRG
jgi:hypothetical protein